MTSRTKEDWLAIMELHASYSGTTKQFCLEHNIPQQSFYARRHAMGLSKPIKTKGTTSVVKNEAKFIKAQLPASPWDLNKGKKYLHYKPYPPAMRGNMVSWPILQAFHYMLSRSWKVVCQYR
jgi:hypothetical protein